MSKVTYNTEEYRYGAYHNTCVEDADDMIGYAIVNPVDIHNAHDKFSNASLDNLVDNLRKIAPSTDWDHNFALGTLITFLRKDEPKLERLKERAAELGYRLDVH